jgi:hypothetical protein
MIVKRDVAALLQVLNGLIYLPVIVGPAFTQFADCADGQCAVVPEPLPN